MRKLLLCSVMLLALPAMAQVYTYIDAEGNRVFTDKPRSTTAQPVQLAPSNSMPSYERQTPQVAPTNEEAPKLRYKVLRILIPLPDANIRDNAGNLIVTADSEPGLYPNHLYRLVMDGKQVGSAQSSPVFALENVDRGTHRIAIEIIDEKERIVERTPSQPFHLHRISLAQKRKANPCKMDEYGVRPECPLTDKPQPKSDIPFVPFI
ncbi:DUF4124 domain-containing protein [Ectopseudomonas mendocina]|uniref:DUF4124 domain-containing protein n=1 Tax=Ectopseudomonas mendocina TaxID=300 RepID=A0ABZ2RI21_ECTME